MASSFSWYNPFGNINAEQAQSYVDQAFGPQGNMTGLNDWVNAENPLYQNGPYSSPYQNMYLTLGQRFVNAAGHDIGDQNALMTYGKNLYSQIQAQLAKNLAGGHTSGTGTLRDAMGDVGVDWLRTGRMGAGMDAGQTYAQIAANVNDPNTSDDYRKLANSGAAYGAIGSLFNRQYAGPYQQLYSNKLMQAQNNAEVLDPFDNSFYRTLRHEPTFQGFNATSNIQSPYTPPASSSGTVPDQSNPDLVGNTGGEIDSPGAANGTPEGPGLGDAAQQQYQFRRQKFFETNGYTWEPWQEQYWEDQARRFGDDYANQKIQNNSLTRARAIARQMGMVDTPPRILNADDLQGLNNFYDFLALDPQNQAELGPREMWLANMQAIIRSYAPSSGGPAVRQ